MQQRSKASVLLDGLGLTQAALGARLGVSTAAVGMWMLGSRKPGHANRLTMLEAFGIPIDAWDEPAVGPSGAHKVASPASPSNVIPLHGRPKPVPDAKTIATESTQEAFGRIAATVHAELLERLLDQLLEQAETNQHQRTAMEQARLLQKAVTTLVALKRMKGEAATEVNVLKHPRYQALKQRIADFLEQRAPEVLGDLATMLEQHEHELGI